MTRRTVVFTNAPRSYDWAAESTEYLAWDVPPGMRCVAASDMQLNRYASGLHSTKVVEPELAQKILMHGTPLTKLHDVRRLREALTLIASRTEGSLAPEVSEAFAQCFDSVAHMERCITALWRT